MNSIRVKRDIAIGKTWVNLQDTTALAAKTVRAQCWHLPDEGVGSRDSSKPWTFHTLISSSPYSVILLFDSNVDVPLCPSKASSKGIRAD